MQRKLHFVPSTTASSSSVESASFKYCSKLYISNHSKEAFDIKSSNNNNNIQQNCTHTKFLTDTQIWHHAIYGNQRLINSIIVTNKILLRIISANLVARVELAEQRIFSISCIFIYLLHLYPCLLLLSLNMISSEKK